MKSIKKSKYVFVIFTYLVSTLIININVKAQWECLYEPGDQDYILENGVGCDDWVNYAPYPNMELVPIKTVRAVIHIIQDENGNNNLENIPAHITFLNEIIGMVNDKLSGLDQLNLGTTPYISDCRIRLFVDDIVFHQNADWWDFSTNYSYKSVQAYNFYVVNNNSLNDIQKNHTLHIMIGGGNYPSVGGTAGVGWGSTMTLRGFDYAYNNNPSNPNKHSCARTINHEFGHNCGLVHNFHGGDHGYQCDDCEDNDPSGLDCPIEGTSNNIMDYWPGGGGGFSQCQIGKMHYYLSGHVENLGSISDDVIYYCDDNITTTIPSNSNIEWYFDNDLPGDLIIGAGATLTVKCELGFPNNAKIVVIQTGKLIIDGGILTNSCDDLWKGVEVRGHTGAPLLADQGLVILKNGAVIENSTVGIHAFNSDFNPAYGNYFGGTIQATDAIFRNNICNIQMERYLYESASYFKNCLFEVTEDFDFYTGDMNMVYLNKMYGVEFQGCNFIKSESVPVTIKPIGIYAINSEFDVVEYCTNQEISPCPTANKQPSWFWGLYYGIKVFNGYPNLVTTFNNINFINNQHGLYLGGTDNASVLFCNFSNSDPNGFYGLYLDGSEGYTIEENTFSGTESYNYVGLLINHSGPLGDNVSYRNTFSNLRYAALAQGENRTGVVAGLQFRCNTFFPNCTYNIMVNWEGQIITNNAGIAANQGANLNEPDGPAGNIFCNTTPGGGATDTDIYNIANHVNYYHHVADPTWQLEPLYYTAGKVLPIPNTNLNAYWDLEESCPPSDQGGGGHEDKGMFLSAMNEASSKADSVETIIQLLEDDGSTENMKTEVELSSPPETYQVYNELMGSSPYISDTVMDMAIEKEEVLPNVMIRDVMVANPHNAKNELLIEKIDERNNTMPDYMKAQILQGGNLVSFYEELQSKRNHFNRQYSEAFNGLVKYYLMDTVNTAAAKDSLIDLLENENSINAKYRLAFMVLEQGDWSLGLGVINNIQQQFDLAGEELERHEQMLSYYNVLAALAQEGKSLSDADSLQIETFFEIEASKMGLPSVYARNVLVLLGEMEYREPILIPDFTKSTTLNQEYAELMQTLDEHQYMKVFPNPAGDYLIIEHKLEVEPENVFAEIRNIQGEIVKDLQLSGKQNQQTTDIQKLKPGIYIVTLFVNSKELESFKFTKTN